MPHVTAAIQHAFAAEQKLYSLFRQNPRGQIFNLYDDYKTYAFLRLARVEHYIRFAEETPTKNAKLAFAGCLVCESISTNQRIASEHGHRILFGLH